MKQRWKKRFQAILQIAVRKSLCYTYTLKCCNYTMRITVHGNEEAKVLTWIYFTEVREIIMR